MKRSLLKRECERCNRSFFTYDADMRYCNSICQSRVEYKEAFGLNDKSEQLIERKPCLQCGTLQTRKFCNVVCSRAYAKKKRTENNAKTWETRKKGKPLPYEVLNKIAERKRVFEDTYGMYK